MYRLYIGSDNNTHKHSEEQLEFLISKISKYFESFTYSLDRGVFRGQEEDTLVATIGTKDGERVEKLAQELRTLLNQEGIGIEHNGGYFRITD